MSVGKNIPHDSACGHVSGESIYIDDVPFARNELVVDFFGSPVPHGRIESLDVKAAQAIPGVVALYTYKDLDGHNRFGPIVQDELLLAEDIVSFIGQPIVVIAAESHKALRKARQAIQVAIQPLPPTLTLEAAIEQERFIGDCKLIERGQLEPGFAAADHILEGTFRIGGQEHFYLESQSTIVYPDEYGALTVHSSTQHPSEVQAVIAEVLRMKFHEVVCVTKRMGGAFGGKESQATHPAAMAALVARKTGRPARIHLSVDDDMKTTGKRHAFRSYYKVGITSEGRITAMQVQLFSDGGAFADLSPAVLSRAMCHAENAYYIPHIKITGRICRTNLPPNTAFRGFGGPQGVATMENIIEEIAQFLKRDAYEIRRLNCYGIEDRNETPYGQIIKNNTLPRLFETLHGRSDYHNRMTAVVEFNRYSKTHLKGLALTPVKFGISFNTRFLNQANALVNIYLDGTVQVTTGATEMGQGVNTKIRQVVAEAFHIPVDWVRMMPTATDKNNNTSATAASSGSDLNGSAALNACLSIRERLLEFARTHLNAKDLVWDERGIYDVQFPEQKLTFPKLVDEAYHARVSLGERGFYATPNLSWDPVHFRGSPFLYHTNGCAVSEVEIDRFTGDVRVVRADLLMDIGQSMNPGIDRGQIVGGFVQGLGWVTTECLRYSETGELLTHSPTTYKIPNIQDLPQVFNVDWIDNPDNTINLRGSKAVGEPPLMLALSVWAAVKHALSFVSNDGIAKLDLPATNEEVLSRLMQSLDNQSNLEPVAEAAEA